MPSLSAVLLDPPPTKEPIVLTPYDRWGRMFQPHDLEEGDAKTWYRLMLFDRPVAPWRPSRSSAVKDALITGNASACQRYHAVFLTAPAWIAVVDLANGEARGG